MTMITPSYLGETIEYSSLHACRSTLEDPTFVVGDRYRWVYLLAQCGEVAHCVRRAEKYQSRVEAGEQAGQQFSKSLALRGVNPFIEGDAYRRLFEFRSEPAFIESAQDLGGC